MLKPFNYNPDVLDCLANLSNDEVFTSPKLVNEILDLLPQALFQNNKTTFLDPVTKTGVFLREITKRLMKGLENEIPDPKARINHILKNQVFGIAITELTGLVSRRSLYCSKTANGKYSICEDFESEQGNILFENVKHSFIQGTCKYCGAGRDYDRSDEFDTHAYQFIHTKDPEEILNMKFDVIIGNPPYQLSDGGSGVSAKPIYNFFVDQARKLNPRYLTMIIPSRWFAGGKGLDSFRDSMLSDKRISTLVDFESSKDCFTGVNIAGGVCYFLWEKDFDGKCKVINSNGEDQNELSRSLNDFPIFVRSNKGISILNKIIAQTSDFWEKNTYPRNPFGFVTKDRGDPRFFSNSIELLSSEGFGYVDKDRVKKNSEIIDFYKVLIGRLVPSNGELDVDPKDGYRVITNTRILKPGQINTESYLVIGAFESLQNTKNFNNYIKTKFARFMLRLSISSVNVTRSCFQFLPSQDFNEKWNDQKLYKKYNLDSEEIEFIESWIRAVEEDDG
jgi:site-specific DNA-methyltransferase (adenine-specific)